jgi:ParB family chromosome partitioning protein
MDEQATPISESTGTPEDKGHMRKRLGRGLNALLGGALPDAQGNEPAADADEAQTPANEISVELIERNPFQPRKDFDKDSLLELAESLITHGMLQPLLVRPHNGGYQLIAGERRWLAAKEAGIETVPCRIMELEDKNICEVALVENLQRKDLSDLEKAKAFQEYLDRFGGTANDLAKQLGMNRSTVANFIRLLALPEAVKKALNAGRITNGHARALLSLEERDQIEMCKQIQKDQLSVRKTEEAVKKLLGRSDAVPDTIPFEPKPEDKPAAEHGGKSNHIVSLEGQLRECLGTKVEIKVTGKDTGKIIVEFNNNAEFERLVKALRNAGPALAIADAA